jgi:hypothetical protein
MSKYLCFGLRRLTDGGAENREGQVSRLLAGQPAKVAPKPFRRAKSAAAGCPGGEGAVFPANLATRIADGGAAAGEDVDVGAGARMVRRTPHRWFSLSLRNLDQEFLQHRCKIGRVLTDDLLRLCLGVS